MPSPTLGGLTLAPGDYSRVCKQTVPSARAFSPHLFERLFCQAGFIRRHSGGKDASGTSRKHRSLRSPLEAVLNRRILACSGERTTDSPRARSGRLHSFVLAAPAQRGPEVVPAKATCGWFWCYLLPPKGSVNHGGCRETGIKMPRLSAANPPFRPARTSGSCSARPVPTPLSAGCR